MSPICFDGCDFNELMCDFEGKTLNPVVFLLISCCNCSISSIKEVQQLVSANPQNIPRFLLTVFEYPCNYSCLNFFCMF